ncbi:hypothetical protein NliqN6_0956 [Naganishia liquefaciens]|uniref:Uncharacterized protein n=1 Tax=Naganishia liquefaciens TaxID=104408 RepID=A0A8H3TPD0_9TREE|nr:hypothetical protein NliqN6_0956 [Naganishia liquefaciens]
MAIVEDYVPDSDDEDTTEAEVLAQKPLAVHPVEQHESNSHATKGSSASELIDQLYVPEAFNDTLHTSQSTPSHIESCQRRIQSALSQLSTIWPRETREGNAGNTLGNPIPDIDVKVYIAVTRLRGINEGPDGTLITPEILKVVDEILQACPDSTKTSQALLLDLKTVFASKPHPDISVDSGRRLMRPVGGEAGRSDLFDDQVWKEQWGTWNTLRWCVEVMSTQDLIDQIPMILPPLLILLDDYKSSYRIRGLQILPAFLRIPPHVLHRTGIAQLLLRSIQHSISLHPAPPEPPLLEASLQRLIDLLHVLYPAGQGKEAEAAKQIEEAVEKGVINGWAYAKSGQEGVEALVSVARAVEMVCREVDLGVIRWMRTFIPSLLSPLMMPPIPYIIPVQLANLQALHTLLVTIEKTGRAARWRGEILDGVGRMVVVLHERGHVVPLTDVERPSQGDQREAAARDHDFRFVSKIDSADERQAELLSLSELCGRVFADLIRVAPSMTETEIPALLALDPNAFGFLRRYQV